MCSVPIEPTAPARAQWLAELSDTLDQAQRLLRSLEWPSECHALAHETFLRIEAARLEVQSLRLSRSLSPRGVPPSEWTEAGMLRPAIRLQSPCGISPPPPNGSR